MFSRGRIQLLILVLAQLLFIPGLGAVHLFDWDEINFAEIAREMVVTGDWSRPQIDYLPFHEKPPLVHLVAGHEHDGCSAWANSRHAYPMRSAASSPCWSCSASATSCADRFFGMLWALAYVGSILPHLYFRSGIIDPWFNLFIFLGLHAIITLVHCDPNRSTGAFNAAQGQARLARRALPRPGRADERPGGRADTRSRAWACTG